MAITAKSESVGEALCPKIRAHHSPKEHCMSNPSLPPPASRFLAVDLHKDYAVIGGVNPSLETVLSPRRIELSRWLKWAECNLLPTDILVIESTSKAWDFYDQVSPLVSKVVVVSRAAHFVPKTTEWNVP
jgi:hypothetical protein